ncbi:MAG: hypothetical protein MK086_05835 [Flavobacteriales bacterium]|nr:hypothetical protein [Flavobacteriales bacterium]
MKYLLIILLFLGFSLSSFGQIRQFTREKQAFVDELTDLLEEADKKEARALIEGSFAPFWVNGDIYNAEHQEKIYDIADLMLKKRLRPFPFYKSFLVSIMSFPGSPQEDEGFDTWVEIIKVLEKGSKKKLENFLTMTENLFVDNVFYQSASTTWKGNNAGWSFKLEGKDYRIVFPTTDLICRAKGDSSVIYSTGGEFDQQKEKWFGKDGKLTWERAGLDPSETYAVIQNPYTLNIRSSFFKLDSVQFFNTFFQYPLLGTMEDKILANVTPEKATYPQFSSYDKRLSIENIVDKVDYNGGFRMEGANLQGFGSKAEPAMLTFKRDNLPQLVAMAEYYTIKPDAVSSADAKVMITLNNDSIIHPSLQLRYKNETRLLTLIRSNEGLSKSPYFDTYHDLELYFEAFYWNIDDPIIRMGNLYGSTETRAAFISSNFFKKEIYHELTGLDRINPLYALRKYARKVNSETFGAGGFCDDLRFQLESYMPRLIEMANRGFINYDIPTQTIEIKQKLFDYIAAEAGNVDYDVIMFNSDVADGDNAELNLVNFDLVLKGVDKILLSDSQQVTIFPKNGLVNVRKNRDFNLGGVIRSGKFEFYGEEFAFNYDKFQIDLVTVDSCRLYVEDFRPEYKSLRRVKNVIEGITGTLQIDNPFNKSGLQEEFTEFPILTADKESFVYYDNSQIQQGVYERSEVFYELEPFTLDSLDNFATEQVAFQGRFVSGGIFPELDESLKVQEDYSLGFVRSTPPGGLPLYGSKATFTKDIIVNFSGIQGNGDLEYFTATASSEQFTFFPDSARGITSSFKNESVSSGQEIPEANATEVDLTYLPLADKLSTEVIKEPINMFDGQAMAKKGVLDLTPKGMTGRGIVEFSGAELESDSIVYNYQTFDADTADFRLLALSEANLAFKTNNVNAHIDFENRVGEFKSNDEETTVEFPVNEYICFMDEFKWFMDKNDISLETSREMASDFVIDTDLDMSRSNFISVREDQDSLNFMSPKAIYDLDTYTITADQIPWIRVADAKITPDSGRVIIRRRAQMDELVNASILANYVTQYHTINDAQVKINSRSDYKASGNYAYVDENKQERLITFESIGVDTSLQTVGAGKVLSIDEFFLSPHFEFQGNINLKSNDKFLTFDGSTRIIHDCERLSKNWMKFESTIDPNNVLIPVDTALTDDRGKLVEIGLMAEKDPYIVYGTFLSEKRDEQNESIVTSRGFLKFNKQDQAYEVANTDKLNQKTLPGNYVSLKVGSCAVTGLGQLNLGDKLGQFGLDSYGELNYDPVEDKVAINSSVALDFYFSDAALEAMVKYLTSVSDLKPVDFTRSRYDYAIREIMGLEKSDKIISELSLSGNIKKLPEDLKKTIFISDVKMVWDPIMESFISEGDIGIGAFGKNQFFRTIPGKFVVEKKASGDVVHLYLEVDDANWYYFTYKRGVLQTYSSDKAFNGILLEEKEDKRKQAGEKKEDNYMYMLGSKSKRSIFLDQFAF